MHTWHAGVHLAKVCAPDESTSVRIDRLRQMAPTLECTCGACVYTWQKYAHVARVCTLGNSMRTWHACVHLATVCARSRMMYTGQANVHTVDGFISR
eukprot:7597882-Pyramimonas_sp.AAC.1